MSGYYDRLQGTDRLLRIRRLRKALFAAIVALSVLLVVARMGSQGASIKPLFLPVNGVIEIALIMGFVTAIVGLFLRNLEIRHAQRDGQRYLMAKSSMARAIRTAGFAIGLAVVLLLAVTPSLTASLFSDAQQVVPFLLFLYGGTQVAWWIVLRPIRDRTKAGSLSVATDLDESERVYDDTVQSPNPDTNPGPQPAADPDIFNIAAASTPAVEVEAPPPPIRTRVPAPPPRVETPKPAPRPVVRQPETAASLATKAGALVATGTYDAALAVYEEALRLDPGHAFSLDGRASCLVRLNRKGEAIEAYKRILTKDAKNLAALRALVRLYSDERRWRECLEAVGELLRLRPNESSALEMKGDALTNLGRRPEALAAYEAAAAIDPKDDNLRQKIEEVRVDVPGLLSRALIASASGNYPQALNLFDDILEVEPSNVNALIGKAVAYRRSGKPQEAVNCLDLVLGVQPNNASALLNRGNILLAEGDLENALDAFDHLTQLYPNDEEAWAAQGDVLVKMGRDDDALRAYTEALQRSPGDEGIQRRILELEAAKTAQPDIFEDLVGIKGIGKTRAKALIDAGFQSAEDFAKASLKDLMVVKGITRKIAEDLTEHFRASLAEAR